MFQNNPLLAQLKQQLHAAAPRISGIVRAHEKGFGFLESDNKKSYFIPTAKMKKLLPGDRIEGTLTRHGDKEQFEPETVLESALSHFIGKIEQRERMWIIYPLHAAIKHPIPCRVPPELASQLRNTSWVNAVLTTRPLQNDQHVFLADIVGFISDDDDILRPWLTTLSRHQLPLDAPALIAPIDLLDGEKTARVDLTDLSFFSIDNPETKDIDDTFCIRMTDDNHGYELTVGIADPSAYIKENSELDNIARQRLFTCYLPDFSVPMLPFEIAEACCSLLPNETRPAVICKLQFDQSGNVIGEPQFSTAWIRSRAKLSYDTVSDYIEQKKSSLDADASVITQLPLLAQLAKCRTAWRQKHAVLFKDKDDFKFLFNEHRDVVSIIKLTRRIANQIVEEAMIAVNLALAHFLHNHIGYGVFNSHNGFDTKHIDTVLKLLNDNQIEHYDRKRLVSFDGYCELRRIIQGNAYLESRLLRYQTSAEYTTGDAPHFGLGFIHYVTWTSPLRKYSDLVNHRILKALIRKKEPNRPSDVLLSALSEKRKQHRYAERDLSQFLYSQFLKEKLGTQFEAIVLDINKGGAKVRLTENGALAFMPISLIHIKRNEIDSRPEEGAILVRNTRLFQISDTIGVILHEIKSDSNTFIVKYQNEI